MSPAKSAAPRIVPVILAGGSGTRFWPKSQRERPKPFLALGHRPPSILATWERLGALADPADIHVALGEHLLDALGEVLPQIPRSKCIVEPEGRDTAPIIAATAWALAARLPKDAILFFCSADHDIPQADAFADAARRAAAAAASSTGIVLFGLVPTYPATGFGYIEVAGSVKAPASSVQQVVRFREKPGKPDAERYLAAGSFYWNAGYFCGTAGAFQAAFRAHMPDIAAVCDAGPVPTDLRPWAESFRKLRKTSFDFGVLDHAKDLRLVPAQFSWTDIGSWESVRRLDAKDAHGDEETHTAIVENPGATAVVIDSPGSYIEAAAGRIVAVLGLENVIVVDTPGALLVAPRDRVEEVKKIVARLNGA